MKKIKDKKIRNSGNDKAVTHKDKNFIDYYYDADDPSGVSAEKTFIGTKSYPWIWDTSIYDKRSHGSIGCH